METEIEISRNYVFESMLTIMPNYVLENMLTTVNNDTTMYNAIIAELTRRVTMNASTYKSTPTKLTVATFNILASMLAKPKWFTATLPEHLAYEYRRERVWDELYALLSNGNDIIALQEVCNQYEAFLRPRIEQMGFKFIHLKGNRENCGFMGVGLIYNPFRFGLVRLLTTTNSETLSKMSLVENEKGDVAYAKERDSPVIYAVFAEKTSGKQFAVASFHMPCEFMRPFVMALHAYGYLKALLEFAGSLPAIALADWNVNTEKDKNGRYGPVFELMTVTGSYTDGVNQLKLPVFWKVNNMPFSTKIVGGFTGELDHILVTPHRFEVVNVDHADCSTITTLPNEKYGSDHMRISATLLL